MSVVTRTPINRPRGTARRARTRWLLGCLLVLLSTIVATRAAPTAAAFAPFAWNSAAPSPIDRFESQGLAVNGKLYVFGGFYNADIQATTRSDVYDPATNTWARIADMPEALTHASQASDGNTIYLVGGYVGDSPGLPTEHVWKYDIASDTWSAGVSLPAPRGGGAAVRVGRFLHFIGGATRTRNTDTTTDHADHFVLNLDGGTSWTTAAAMPNPRNHLAGVALNDKIYVLGGQLGNLEGTQNQSEVDVYDPATNAWSRAADLPTARSHISSSTFVMGGRIVVVGGSVDNGIGGAPSDGVFVYEPYANAWSTLSSLPEGRKTPVADAIGDRIVVTTGNKGEPTNTTWIAAPAGLATPLNLLYLPFVAGGAGVNAEDTAVPTAATANPTAAAPGEPTATGPTATATQISETPSATVTPSATTPGAPAATATATATATAIATATPTATKTPPGDPHTFTTIDWSPIASAPKAHSEAQRAVVNGKMYVFGGFAPCCTPTRRVFVYDPVKNTWTRLADMPKGLTHAGMTTDGTDIYYAGGYIEGDSGTGQKFGTRQVWRYNVASNTYTPMPDLPVERAAGVLALVGRNLHYIGGTNIQRTVDVTDHYVLSLDGGTAWTTAAPLPNGRHHMGVAVLDGLIYAIGGQHGHDGKLVPQTDVHRYDPATNTWTQMASLPLARNHITNATVVYGGRIIIFGGQVKHNVPVDNVEAYDPKTNTWTELTPLPMPRHSAVAGEINGVFYFSGGSTALGYKGVPGWGQPVASSTSPQRVAYSLDDAESLFICR